MDFVGEIVSEPDSPGFNKTRWTELIREHPNLSPIQPREAINPFTRKPMPVYATPYTARVVVDGQDMGLMHWSLDESVNLVIVFGDPKVVCPLARSIAESLGGRFKAN